MSTAQPFPPFLHRIALHGHIVELTCHLPAMNQAIDDALGVFAVVDRPADFSPIVAQIRAFDEGEIRRLFGKTAERIEMPAVADDVYRDGERVWMFDDRWGVAAINTASGTLALWPTESADPRVVIDRALLVGLSRLLAPRGLKLLPAAAVARDGFAALLITQAELEPELTTLARAGWSVIAQRWVALQEDAGRVEMLALPGYVERAAMQHAHHAPVDAGRIDLHAETPACHLPHAFCDAVALIEAGRRPLPLLKQYTIAGAVDAITAAWPAPLATAGGDERDDVIVPLAKATDVYRAQLSRRPEDFVRVLDQVRRAHRATFRVAV